MEIFNPKYKFLAKERKRVENKRKTQIHNDTTKCNIKIKENNIAHW